MNKPAEGSTFKLLQLCFWYFFFYVITGVVVKYFQFYPHGPQLNGVQYLTYSTIGGAATGILVILFLRWFHFDSVRLIKIGFIKFPSEFLYIAPAGFCTAIIVPATTLLYSIHGISVMVAMVIMRGSVIIIGRIVDAIQIHQGILKKKVYMEENLGVLFAMFAVAVKLFWGEKGDLSFVTHVGAMIILCSYVAAYGLRIYIMNYFKNTRPKNMVYNSKSYFAVEQIFMAVFLVAAAVIVFFLPKNFGGSVEQIALFHNSLAHPAPVWLWAILGGTAFGALAVFSVFIFMYKGRTATFAGLVNRLTSLVAGTVATLIFWFFFNGKFPELQDWLSLLLILIAIAFMTKAEKKRMRELTKAREVETK